MAKPTSIGRHVNRPDGSLVDVGRADFRPPPAAAAASPSSAAVAAYRAPAAAAPASSSSSAAVEIPECHSGTISGSFRAPLRALLREPLRAPLRAERVSTNVEPGRATQLCRLTMIEEIPQYSSNSSSSVGSSFDGEGPTPLLDFLWGTPAPRDAEGSSRRRSRSVSIGSTTVVVFDPTIAISASELGRD